MKQGKNNTVGSAKEKSNIRKRTHTQIRKRSCVKLGDFWVFAYVNVPVYCVSLGTFMFLYISITIGGGLSDIQ